MLFGTRGSALALAQTRLVLDRLATYHPDQAVATVVVRTEGDADKVSPLTVIGGRGVFTSALQDALLRQQIDAAVHSAKDLPSHQPPGLRLIALLARADPRDVFISRHGLPLAAVAPAPVIGTSSRRRAVQIKTLRPDAQVIELRGNVDTRLRKALDTELDGIVIAAAGVSRMGWDHLVTEYLPVDHFVPSPGQGALAVEVREAPNGSEAMLAALDEPSVSLPVRVERAFLAGIGGGCMSPVGAFAEPEGDRLRLRAMLASPDETRVEWLDEFLPDGGEEPTAFALAQQLRTHLDKARSLVSTNGIQKPPLAGKVVLVTRAADQASDLSQRLRQAGAEPLELPTLRIEDPTSWTDLDAAFTRLVGGAYDWITFTSANTVVRVLNRLAARDLTIDAFGSVRIAAVGVATAARLGAAGIAVDLLPKQATADALLDALVAAGVEGQRLLGPHGNQARDLLGDGLRRAGATVDVVEVYRTVPVASVDPAIRARIQRGDVNAVAFASPSAARGLVALLGDDLPGLARAAIACIGPVTAATVRDLGLPVHVVAEDSTIPGLVAALIAHVSNQQPSGSRDLALTPGSLHL